MCRNFSSAAIESPSKTAHREKSLIEITNLTKTYREPNKAVRILFDQASLHISDENRLYALVGRSGSGKSTLLSILAGLDLQFKGEYRFRGKALAKKDAPMAHFRRRNVGFVTQHHHLLRDRDVLHNILIGEKNTESNRTRALECLAEVGLPNYAKRNPETLSGGEAQRIAIARAAFQRPALLLADEPTGSLDETSEAIIVELFKKLIRNGSTVIVATHSPHIAEECDAQLVIENRAIYRK